MIVLATHLFNDKGKQQIIQPSVNSWTDSRVAHQSIRNPLSHPIELLGTFKNTTLPIQVCFQRHHERRNSHFPDTALQFNSIRLMFDVGCTSEEESPNGCCRENGDEDDDDGIQ